MRRGIAVGIAALAVVALVVFFTLGPGGGPRRTEPPPGPVRAPISAPPGLAPAAMDAAMDAGTAAGMEPAAAAKTGTLVVRVTARGAGPVARAKVGVFADEGGPWRGDTDADGAARFLDLPAGSYGVRADADGFAGDEKEDVEVEAGAEATVAVELEAGVAFDGTVVDVRDGKPVAGARVVADSSGSVGGFAVASSRAPFDRTRTDDEGRFRVRGVPEGSVTTLEVTAEGYQKGELSLRILDGKVTPGPAVVRLTPGGRIVGVVRDPAGKPLAGATVYVMRAWETELRKNPRMSSWSSDGTHSEAAKAATDDAGRYVVGNLALDEEYVAVASAEGFARSAEATGLNLDLQRLEATADLVVRKPAGLVVRLVDLDEKPVLEPAQVQVGEFIGGTRKTAPDEGNEYRFAGLNVGETRVSVTASSFRPAKATPVLEAGVTTELVVHLDPGASVEGVVVGDDGNPVPGAEVSVGPAKANEKVPAFDDHVWYLMDDRNAKTDAEGRFRVAGLEPGEVVVGAEKGFGPSGQPVLRPREVLRVRAPAKDLRLFVVALGSASLRLVTPDGKPWAGSAYLLYARHGEGKGGGSESVKDGVVRIHSLPRGAVDVSIAVEGYAPIDRTFESRLGEHKDLGDVRLDPGVEIHGRVLDLAGNPVAGARVAARGPSEGATTDARGTFVLPHQPRTTVRVEASADGFLDAEADAVPGGPLVEFRLAHGALVRGVVRTADGKPATDTSILAVRLDPAGQPLKGPDDREWDRSGEDGKVKWRLPAGRWRFALGLPSGEEIPLTDLTLSEGDTKDLDLTLPAR